MLKLLILSDFFIFSGFGLIMPILAIFIKENLAGGSIEAAGIAVTIFILTKSILQPTFAYIAQPKHIKAMLFFGTALMVLIPVVYFFSTHVFHVYIASFIYGVATAIAYPPWLKLFTQNITRGREGLEWSIYSSIEGLGSALAAFVGGFIAERFGFYFLFLIVCFFILVGLVVVIFIILEYQKIREREQKDKKQKQ
jgi:MFS family permease